ncbi:MAG TPA: T9SS type A sorting domain-containing protein [Chitinophagaceae bacterium]|nr:T9SS type A sorting domain-containing protein [Chitinophagaceae bacterium]
MKTFRVTALLLLTTYFTNAQQGDIFGILTYFPGTCKVQVEYWIRNPTSGFGSFDVAISRVNLQWDSSLLNFVSYTSYTKELDETPDHWSGTNKQYPEAPDTVYDGSRIVTDSTKTVVGNNTSYSYSNHSFQTKVIQRSTDSCDNLFSVAPGESKPIASAILQFKNCDSAYNYNFTDPNSPDFIADFATSSDIISHKTKILFVIDDEDRPKDPPGVNCSVGSGDQIKNIDNIPIGSISNLKFENTSGVLPVNLLHMLIANQNNRAALQWETNYELNNMGFEVQRKTSGGFKPIAFVNSKSDYGNSNQNIKYNFVDPDYLAIGTSYYRLRQVGINGAEHYSEVKAIRSNSKLFQILVYPNPANDIINIVIPAGKGMIDIDLMDIYGRIINSWHNYSAQKLQVRQLKKGIYSIVVTNKETGEKVSQKMTVL